MKNLPVLLVLCLTASSLLFNVPKVINEAHAKTVQQQHKKPEKPKQ